MTMMKYKLFLFLIWCHGMNGSAQTPQELIAKVNKNFAGVKDYSADLMMNFSIPGVNIEPMAGKVFYKRFGRVGVIIGENLILEICSVIIHADIT